MKKIQLIIPVVLLLFLVSCNQKGPGEATNAEVPLATDLFEQSISLGRVELADIDEASGLVASRSNPYAFWTHNDSGGKNRLFLLGNQGQHLGIFTLKGVKARDWEDIAIGPGPKEGANYIYVGEIGDNKGKYDIKKIYRFIEPDVSQVTSATNQKISKDKIETIRFRFPDGNRDAEAMMVDPLTKDIFMVTKREDNVRVYVLRYPQSTTEVSTLERVGTLPLHKIVAGDISPDGKEVLLKDYGNIYYWQKSENESIEELLKNTPKRLPYIVEPQGESIAWAADGSGFYTVSEERQKVPAELLFYKRIH